jgi:hypothetical protein
MSPNPLTLTDDQRRLVIEAAADVPTALRERFLNAVVDSLTCRAPLTAGEINAACAEARRKFILVGYGSKPRAPKAKDKFGATPGAA